MVLNRFKFLIFMMFVCALAISMPVQVASHSETIEQLIEKLGDPDVTLRQQAARHLSELAHNSKTAALALSEALEDSDQYVRLAAQTLNMVDNVYVPVVVAFAARTLGVIGVAQAESIRAALRDEVWYVRMGAVEAAGALGAEAAIYVPDLAKALEDPVQDVRYSAVKALGKIGPPAIEAIDALTRALDDRDRFVLEAAEEAIAAILSEQP